MIAFSSRRTRGPALGTGIFFQNRAIKATGDFDSVFRSGALQRGILAQNGVTNPTRSSTCGCNSDRKLAPDQRFSTFGYEIGRKAL